MFFRAIRGESIERFPVWMMRQAGRYQASYQKLRKSYSFNDMIHQPELGADVTLLPINESGFDAAILFSDILVVCEALGCNLNFIDGIGPVIDNPINLTTDLDRLKCDDPSQAFAHIFSEIQIIKQRLPHDIPLIGFAGAPFTVASYMMGSGKGHDLKQFKKMMFETPDLVHAVLQQLTDFTAFYISEQIKAGVDLIQIFDSWNQVLSWSDMQVFALPYIKQMIAKIENPNNIPIFMFGLGNSVFYPLLQDIGLSGISFDSRIDIARARDLIDDSLVVQGNLDPYLLLAPQPVLEQALHEMLESMRHSKRYIVNLGHGIMPDVPEENVKFFVDYVKNFAL